MWKETVVLSLATQQHTWETSSQFAAHNSAHAFVHTRTHTPAHPPRSTQIGQNTETGADPAIGPEPSRALPEAHAQYKQGVCARARARVCVCVR